VPTGIRMIRAAADPFPKYARCSILGNNLSRRCVENSNTFGYGILRSYMEGETDSGSSFIYPRAWILTATTPAADRIVPGRIVPNKSERSALRTSGRRLTTSGLKSVGTRRFLFPSERLKSEFSSTTAT
jgi:hypothetical protein